MTSSDNPLVLTMDGDKSLSANYSLNTYTLTVNATNGTVTKLPDQAAYDHDTVVQLTAVPATGYHFVNWTGDASGTEPTTSVTMDGNRSVTANFAIDTFTLTYTAGTGGTISGLTPQTVNYGDDGTLVTAVPNTGWHFVDWSDGVLTASRTDLDVSANIAVTANFAIDTYTLAVTSDHGTIVKAPDLPAYDYGTSVTITATPAVGYAFTGWTGSVTSSDNPLVLTMDGDKSISANYSLNTYTLTVNATNGTVTKLPDQAAYDHDTVVQLTAVPATGYHFVNWTGDASGTELTTSVTMDGNRSVTANFAIDTFTLTYTAGTGGTISGLTPQTVNYGDDGTLVTAVPNTGWRFVDWSDGVLTASRTDLDVSANIAVTANFAIDTYTLAVTSDHGTIVKAPDLPAYDYGTSVTITATPAVGYAFTGWTGSVTSSDNPLVLTMDGDKSISANYSLNTYTLTVNATNGTVTKLPDQSAYDHDTVVQLTAVPATGYHFVNWTGDASGTELTTSVTMDGAKSVTANFAIDTFTLTYTAGEGGAVTGVSTQTVNYGDDGTLVTAVANTGWHFVDWSDGVLTASRTDLDVTANITVTANFAINTYTLSVASDHGTIVKAPDLLDYDYGTSVTITATPATGYTFTGWTGSVASADNPLTLTMDGDKTLTANYLLNTYTLTVNATNGTVTKLPDQSAYDHDTVVQLTAVPATGYHFLDWTGDASGTELTTSVTMDGNKSVTANFAINRYTLTILRAGSGAGVVTSIPSDINCGSTCSAMFNYGQVVSLTATPNSTSSFYGWSGDLSGAVGTQSVTMDGDKSVVATFNEVRYTLTVASVNGTVTKVPDAATYLVGTAVQLTASPSTGYHFVNWTGDTSGTELTTSVTMDGDKSVTANFAINVYTLTYTAGEGGSITGTLIQTVDYGGSGTLVTAEASLGYHFVDWSDGVLNAGQDRREHHGEHQRYG